MERATGIEPATPSLGSSYSTAELRPLYRRQCRIISTARQRGQAYPAEPGASVRAVTLPANEAEYLVAAPHHVRLRSRLEVEPQQRLRVGRPHVEVPVRVVHG